MTSAADPLGPGFWPLLHDVVAAHQPRALARGARMQAAVLIAFTPHAGDPRVIFTVRSHDVEHHKGEISFPGGAHDADDPDLVWTALREAHEEVGIDPAHVRIVGEMSPWPSISGFHVTPYVGTLDRAPYQYTPSPLEVAEVLEVPLAHLLDLANREDEIGERNGQHFATYRYHWNGHEIWGLTARMLHDLLQDLARPLGLYH